MNLVDPRQRVLRIPGSLIAEINRLERTPFTNPLSADQREAAVHSCTSGDGTLPFNGGAIRLDAARTDPRGGLELTLSRVEFFDFLSTNCVNNAPGSHGVRDRLSPRSYQDVLADSALANIIAVSLVVEDSEGRIGIAKRSPGVHVSSGAYCATVTGTLDDADFQEPDPFAYCTTREAAEELGLAIPDPRFDGVVISVQKLQPVFMYSARLDSPWEEYVARMAAATDARLETDALVAVPLDQCVAFIAQHDMTDVAAYQLWAYASERGSGVSSSG